MPDDLTKSLAELGEMIDRNMARIATLEAERDAANIKAYGLLKMSERLESALASKQRAIDTVLMLVSEPSSGREHHIASILRPEATPTDAKPQPVSQADELPPIGQHHPDDQLVTEWDANGFRIVKQPEEWRGKFAEEHCGFRIVSAWTPLLNGYSLWIRGDDRNDERPIEVPASDRPRVWAAIVSLNAKHRKKADETAPTSPKLRVWECKIVVRGDAELPCGFDQPPRRAAITAVNAAGFDILACASGWTTCNDSTWDHIKDRVDYPAVVALPDKNPPQPAQPEPSGDSVTVTPLKRLEFAMLIGSKLFKGYEWSVDGDFSPKVYEGVAKQAFKFVDAIIAECDAAEGASDAKA